MPIHRVAAETQVLAEMLVGKLVFKRWLSFEGSFRRKMNNLFPPLTRRCLFFSRGAGEVLEVAGFSARGCCPKSDPVMGETEDTLDSNSFGGQTVGVFTHSIIVQLKLNRRDTTASGGSLGS